MRGAISAAAREEHVGVVTDRDIVRASLDLGADIAMAPALKVMTPDPLVLSEVESVETAITRLRERH